MIEVVKEAGKEDKLDLIRAHPKLGAKKKMSITSTKEQQGAGLHDLSPEESEEFYKLNEDYEKKFNFPFIFAVKGKTKRDIYDSLQERVTNSQNEEFEKALGEVYKIALFRLKETYKGDDHMTSESRLMTYGKGDVFAYRTFMPPLTGLQQIPESTFEGKSNTVFGVNASIEIGGKAFLPSFAEGDNSLVVATDSMKNFIQRHLADYEGSTLEGFLDYTARRFLEKYTHVDTIKMTGVEIPFESAVGIKNGESSSSDLVFKRSRNEQARSTVSLERINEKMEVTGHSSEITDLQLVKVKGNSFVGFIRDEYTTLPEDGNRPLFIYLNIGWTYENQQDSLGTNPLNYVAAEQVKDIASTVFDEIESPSIQYLIYLIGCRVLERFPQLKEVTFQSQNRTWDVVVEDIPGSEGKVYTEPRLPYGFQRFSVTKDDLNTSAKKAVTSDTYK